GVRGPRCRAPFPTRRSSDLRAILGDSPTLLGGLLGVGTLLVLQALSGQARRVKAGARLVNSPALVLMAGPNLILDNLNRSHIIRSEEHTSELQSRENLVCRL